MVKGSRVYFLPWKRAYELEKLLFEAEFGSCIRKGDYAAIKIHFGERGSDGYIKPKSIRPIIRFLRRAKAYPFATDTNTIYRGTRSDAVSHLVVAAEHGYSQTKIGIPIIISDGIRGTSFKEVKIKGEHFKKVKIAAEITDSDIIVAVSHVKGHLLCGFGGTIKNLGMGCAAKVGKYEMHAGTSPAVDAKMCKKCGACIVVCPENAISYVDGIPRIDIKKCVGCGQCVAACNYACLNIPWGQPSKVVQERIAEYALGAVRDRRLFCVNFVNHITPNCDCMGKVEEPLTEDVGILASTDPVAIDEASLDLIKKTAGHDVFKKIYPDIDHKVQIRHAEKVRLGSRKYELIEIG